METYLFQCYSCGGTRTFSARTLLDVPAALADRGLECVECGLRGGPRFPLWRWRVIGPGTPAEQLAVIRYGNALYRAVRARYG